METIRNQMLEAFWQQLGPGEEPGFYFAPGRVNLIGEHTDYNGGHVFPCALTMGTYGLARKRKDRSLRFYSLNFPEQGVLEGSLSQLRPDPAAGWSNYPKGVLWTLEQKGIQVPFGIDLLLYGNIPNGSGLSSSASVEVLTGFVLRDLYGLELSNIDLALYGQYGENHFNGVNCGIMDQFAIAMGKADHAIFLDTADLSFVYAPIALEGVKIVISCSNKKRGLGDSKYNERRSECEQALSELRTVPGYEDLSSLGALQEDAFEQICSAIESPVRQKRARHAVTENQRTLQAVSALERGDLEHFGRLMNASHRSLRDDYEVTGPELDALVHAAWQVPGVIGSRMTGAGFGGCTVSLVREEAVEQFIRQVGEAYLKEIGYAADFYVAAVGGGPVRLS